MTSVEISPAMARDLTDRIKVGVDAIWELIKQAYTSRAWSVLGYSSWDDYCTREFGTSRIRLPREERQEVVASMREIGMSTRAIASATGTHYSTVSRELSGGVANATPDAAPAPVTGVDGKTYTPRPKSTLEELTAEVETIKTDLQGIDPETSPDEYGRKFSNLVDAESKRREVAPGLTADDLDALNVTPAPEPAEPPKPKRRPLEEQFLDAIHKLTSVCTTLQNLGNDDRLPRNREQVARYRSDLLRAIDTLHRVADQLS